MSITYTWNIQKLECYKIIDDYQNVVFNVQGVLVGSDGQDIGIADFAQELTFIPGDNFTAYEDLTVTQVTDWVQTAMPAETLDALKAQIDVELHRKKSNKEILPPPWIGPAV